MANWDDGYVSEIEYTYGYYPELNPLQARLHLLHAGFKPPTIRNACELGFGQGVSILTHSAGDDIKWYGTDFNPDQVAFAKNTASAAGLSAELYDDDFAAFCSRDDLPKFDYIGLHGIWSWISTENQQRITRFIRERLNVGGVLYISYNCAPGRSAMVPVRELLTLHSEANPGGNTKIQDKISNSIDFVSDLFATEPAFVKANPTLAERVKELKKQQREYLAHEYFNRDWQPMSFADMHGILTDAKLRYAASANALDALPDINYTQDQLKIINGIDDMSLREVVKDFCRNQSFRKEFWVKGATRLTAKERLDALMALTVVLTQRPEDIELNVKTTLGVAGLNEPVYRPILNAFSGSASLSIAELSELVSKNVPAAQVIEAVMVLAGKGVLSLAKEEVSEASAERTTKLNSLFAMKSKYTMQVTYLSSPTTSTCVPVSRFEQLFMLALKDNVKDAEGIAKFAWDILEPQGQKIIKEGKPLESPRENLDELTELAKEFLEKKWPVLQNLKVAV
jgi:hypothetical protein